LTRASVVDRLPPFRLPDDKTVNARVSGGGLRLTLVDGRETSRTISGDAADAYWQHRRHFVLEDPLAAMRTELRTSSRIAAIASR
jgi:hypothetical protein